ncbi:hypothetical protein G9A89_005238 [Geosiphon pyriformis]|nr:hypothetical protein G9A89_005238 [Geosiphon pyriformis]
MAYAPIAKLDKFTGEEDNAQVWLNNVKKAIAANGWNDARAMQAIPYFLKDTVDSYNLSAATSSHLSIPTTNSNTATKLASKWNPKAKNDTTKLAIGDGSPPTDPQFVKSNYLSFLVIPKDVQPNDLETNFQLTLTSNILPATITEDKSLAAIFPFEIKEPSEVPLFSGITIEEKPIMAMYTNAKIDGHSIKLILNSGSADSIITRQLIDQLDCRIDCAASTRIITANGAIKTPIGEIDDLPIEINGITVSIKVLVMEATQYQALVNNNWLSKTNTMLNWNIQELQLSQNDQHTQVPATCGHFKPNNVTSLMLLIDFEEEKPKPTWEAYQVLWANIEHNELPLILDWEEKNNKKGKEIETEEHTWETTINAWNNNNESKAMSTNWEEKGKGKEKEEDLPEKANEATEKITSG